MKRAVLLFFVFVLCSNLAVAQTTDTVDFYAGIKKFNLSKVFKKDTMHIDDSTRIKFPEPLAILGDGYERFYIHYLSIEKSRKNPYEYIVKGKTRYKDNIYPFKGVIRIRSAYFYKDSDLAGVPCGIAVCDVKYNEDSNRLQSGVITGQLITYWYQDKFGIVYNDINLTADGFSNNQFTGKRKTYRGSTEQKCNWGDFRIPDSGDLDAGAGEFVPDEKYYMSGWKYYTDSHYGNDTLVQKRALEVENKEWWNE